MRTMGGGRGGMVQISMKAYLGEGEANFVHTFYSAPPLLTTEHCSCPGGNQFALLSPGSIVQGKQ